MSRRRSGRDVHGILLLDKAEGLSSNKALQQVKHLFKARKAGHTGTLDPLATGMLPVCLGEATKISHFLLDSDKQYLAGARFGVTTDTGDRDGTELESRPLPEGFNPLMLESAITPFLGEIMQVPPMYSALKHEGRRLYELARQGQTVDRKARAVTIHDARLISLENDLAMISVRCSKGTYIRTLIEDIGASLGCGAHIDSLRRVAVSPFDQQAMLTLNQLETTLQESHASSQGTPQGASVEARTEGGENALAIPALDALLLPIDNAIKHLEAVELDQKDTEGFRHGRDAQSFRYVSAMSRDASAGFAEAGDTQDTSPAVRVYDFEGRFMGIGTVVDGARLSPKRVLNL